MTSDEAFRFIKFICRTSQSGVITPAQYGLAVSSAQNSFYDFLIGEIERYPMGKPVPPVAVGMSKKIARFLSPLKVPKEEIAVASGIAPYPATMDFAISMEDASGGNISIVDDTKKSARIKSKLDPPSTSQPFCVLSKTGFEVYPTTLDKVYLNYYFRPPNSVWGYDIDGNGREVYNAGTSVHPVFDDVAMQKVLARAIRLLGFSFTEEEWIQYGMAVKVGGE